MPDRTQLRWVSLPGATFFMGSDEFYPEEAPRHERTVAPFALTHTPVTNAQFAEFVLKTGYVTVAEQGLPAEDFPDLTEEQRAPGSLVFTPTDGPVDLHDWRQWWRWIPGAFWREPFGPGSSIEGKDDHPVVQVAFADAEAYAVWAGGRLPTETELEYAATGGSVPQPYAWGRDREPGGEVQANTWRGDFPFRNEGAKGFVGTSEVASFPPNPFGLYDTIGNVWEWTSTLMTANHRMEPREIQPTESIRCACSPARATGPSTRQPRNLVLKGGSHLCAPEYCLRYRPAARSPQAEDSATTHIGFRVARDAH